jgi:two-component system sensor kinase
MNKNKILIVDDEVGLRETISELLIFSNYSVMTAENGQEALEILDYWTPDLIISDIMMPVMDGYLFQEIVNGNELLNHIPFIFLTAKTDASEMEKSILNGVDLFLTKPFKIEELIKIIEVKIERFEKIKNAYNNINTSNSSNFTHEVHTPLDGILNNIDVLIGSENNLEETDIAEFHNSIKTFGERLDRTLKNSILYQNLKNNKLEFSDFSSTEVLSSFLKVKDKITLLDKNLARRIRFDVEESNIKIKEEYLHFILFELMSNALRFSEINKKIIVSGKKYNSEHYELAIQDFGIGFDDEELKKIEINQQLNRKQSELQGLGLGLFISKTFVKKIKGLFSINSQKNVGTTIIIYFPLQIEEL